MAEPDLAEPDPPQADAPTTAPLASALRTTHRAVLGLIFVSVLVVITADKPEVEAPPDRALTMAMLCVAALAIVLRRLSTSPVIPVRAGVYLALAGLLACAAIGAFGVYAALALEATKLGLGSCLAGGIFALRPPEVLHRLEDV